MIKYPIRRKGNLNKVYMCTFICLLTKACHLELLTDINACDAFMNALKRFISRQEKMPLNLLDNATNFIVSNTESKRLRELVEKSSEKLCNFLVK